MGYIGVTSPTDPITFDPNFQRDIQVQDSSHGNPSWESVNRIFGPRARRFRHPSSPIFASPGGSWEMSGEITLRPGTYVNLRKCILREKKLQIASKNSSLHNPKQPSLNGSKWWNNPFFIVNDLVHHPIDSQPFINRFVSGSKTETNIAFEHRPSQKGLYLPINCFSNQNPCAVSKKTHTSHIPSKKNKQQLRPWKSTSWKMNWWILSFWKCWWWPIFRVLKLQGRYIPWTNSKRPWK